jgi:hypothetical protein
MSTSSISYNPLRGDIGKNCWVMGASLMEATIMSYDEDRDIYTVEWKGRKLSRTSSCVCIELDDVINACEENAQYWMAQKTKLTKLQK